MRLLFERIAVPMARAGTRGAWLRGLRVMAIDGLVLDVPATPDNDKEFGRSGNATAPSPFPQVRLVALGECGTHGIVPDAAFGPVTTGEQSFAERLIARFTPDMLVLADRNFYSYQAWQQARATGAQLLWRVSAGLRLPVLEWLPDGSYRSVLINPKVRGRRREQLIAAAAAGAELDPAQAMPVRAVEYLIDNRAGEELFCLITTIGDHAFAAAVELAAAYAQRWEIELSFDEIEIHQTGGQRVLRSRTPELVKQEIWSLLLTHYAIRHVMKDAADTVGTDPDDLRSYAATARSAARSLIRPALPPDRLADALTKTIDEIVEERLGPRQQPTCPRVVKRHRAHSHRIKRETDPNGLHPDPPKIHILRIECLT